MSILKVNEVQVFNGSTVTITATTTAASGAVTVGGNLAVSGAISSSDASTTRTNLGLGTISTQAANSVDIDGGAIDGVTVGTNSAVTDLRVDNLKLDANTISSTDTDGNITIDPNGSGNVVIGNFSFDADQSVGAGEDNYVLTYDNTSGLISLEAASGGGGSGTSQPIAATIPNYYLASQQLTGGNDASAGFYEGSSTAAERRTVNVPAMQLRIDSTVYTLSSATTLDADTSGSWPSGETTYATAANRIGLDFYLYAVEPSSGTTPNFCLSANSSYPNGTVGGVTARAANSRKLGGFHCLCAAVGTISGHSLTGYLAGDILPRSVWTQHAHRPESNPEGMVFVGNRLWADIYLASNTTTLESSNGGTIVDGASNPDYHWYNFVERFAEINKRLPTQAEFMALAIGSNEETNISGSSDPGTTGGHSDTAGRRMISNVGCEDCAGALWQWCNETGSDGAAASYAVQDTAGDATTYDGANSIGRGQGYGVPNRGRLGGVWNAGALCGSRGVNWFSSPLILSSNRGSRGVSGSL
jgi:hypothetical protein